MTSIQTHQRRSIHICIVRTSFMIVCSIASHCEVAFSVGFKCFFP